MLLLVFCVFGIESHCCNVLQSFQPNIPNITVGVVDHPPASRCQQVRARQVLRSTAHNIARLNSPDLPRTEADGTGEQQ